MFENGAKFREKKMANKGKKEREITKLPENATGVRLRPLAPTAGEENLTKEGEEKIEASKSVRCIRITAKSKHLVSRNKNSKRNRKISPKRDLNGSE